MQATSDPADLFIFRRWTISELHRLSSPPQGHSGPRPYSEVYLLALKKGSHPINLAFRLRMAKALDTDEGTLFATEVPA